MAILRKIFIFVLPLILTGCHEELDLNIDTTPVLCLNSLITAGEPISVKVTHTWVYTDESSRKDHSVKDAVLSIYVNDELKEYGCIPKEGDRIRLSAYSPTYGSAEAEVTVPYATRIDDLTHSQFIRAESISFTEGWGVNAHLSLDISATLSIPNDKVKDNFYMLEYEKFQSEEHSLAELLEGRFEYQDPIFTEHISEIEDVFGFEPDGNIFFSDKQFTGDTYGMQFAFKYCGFYLSGWNFDPDVLNCGYELTLNSISESFYKWLNYSWQSTSGMLGEFGDIGLAEQMWAYSNVTTGAGLVAARSSTTVTLNLRDYLYDTILDSIQE